MATFIAMSQSFSTCLILQLFIHNWYISSAVICGSTRRFSENISSTPEHLLFRAWWQLRLHSVFSCEILLLSWPAHNGYVVVYSCVLWILGALEAVLYVTSRFFLPARMVCVLAVAPYGTLWPWIPQVFLIYIAYTSLFRPLWAFTCLNTPSFPLVLPFQHSSIHSFPMFIRVV